MEEGTLIRICLPSTPIFLAEAELQALGLPTALVRVQRQSGVGSFLKARPRCGLASTKLKQLCFESDLPSGSPAFLVLLNAER